jgi:hypothetical protein
MTGPYRSFCPYCNKVVNAFPKQSEKEFLEDLANGQKVEVMHPSFGEATGPDHEWTISKLD